MSQLTLTQALRSAVLEEMRSDPKTILMGQDVELFFREACEQFGRDRVRSTPISETAFIGAGIGAALTGVRSIVELGCSTFLYSAMDQVINQAAKSRYMFGGQASVPLVIRAPVLYSISAAAHHADRPWGLFASAPGIKIIVPTTPYDGKGLLKSAIRDGNPVLCFEDASLRSQTGEVPNEDYTVPIGLADIKRTGTDLTIVSLAAAVHRSLSAAQALAIEGISAEVIDLRTVVPIDSRTIITSVKKTGRLIVVDPAPRTCGVAAEIAAIVAEEVFDCLKSPIIRVTAPDVPAPFSPGLESLLYPSIEAVVGAANNCMRSGANRRRVA